MSDALERRKLAAIMFTDMVGYSALAQRDEALALELLEYHRTLLRPLFPRFNGREVETAGDAFLIEFASALEAVRCALEIQRILTQHNQSHPDDRTVRLRIGIHVGDVVQRHGKLMGDAVNIAARIYPLAEPGGICISQQVHDQIHNKLNLSWVNLGPAALKNISMPMGLYRVELPALEKPPSPASIAPPQPGRNRGQQIGLTVAALGVVLLAIFAWRLAHHQVTAPTPPAARHTIAVLPFVNMSSNQENEYLSDGLTEHLITALSQVKSFRITARTSAFAFKGKNQDVREIGRQLNVATVLEGSVQQQGGQLRITAQLINVADGFHVWSDTYDREMKGLFAIQDDVARQVVSRLKITLAAGEEQRLRKQPTDNVEAYRLYLLGLYYWNRRDVVAASNAITQFKAAIELDPKFALAYAMLADTYSLGLMGLPRPVSLVKMLQAAAKALALDYELGEAHVILARSKFHEDWDWAGAEKEYRLALELNPSFATAYQRYSLFLIAMGRVDESLSHMRQAHELDPISLSINTSLGWRLTWAGRHDEAIEQLRKTIAMDSGFAGAHDRLGLAYVGKGELDAAIAEFSKAIELSRNSALVSLAHAYALAGKSAQAREYLDQLQRPSEQGLQAEPYDLAIIYTGLGETDQALASLEKAYREGAGDLVYLQAEPRFAPLRTHPRFNALLRSLRLAP